MKTEKNHPLITALWWVVVCVVCVTAIANLILIPIKEEGWGIILDFDMNGPFGVLGLLRMGIVLFLIGIVLFLIAYANHFAAMLWGKLWGKLRGKPRNR